MAEMELSKKFFRRLSDAELFAWRPESPRGFYGWSGTAGINVGRANREMRRRTKVAGYPTVYAWLEAIQPQSGTPQ